ncbi:MAG TPA: Asp-tRNA(Asn)/Glu-tRNA(Gln) amidotransferase subunit GatA, partial [Verrucomicrobiales bacterium]|nr:Asp-tRNA(Asn)/Glu-tRNA(Gln) amidotransferase subunit GatA [Verrucomicrobiales bacterium]
QSCLNRIETVDKSIHAFLSINKQGVLDQAEKADREIAEKGLSADRPLLGIPIAIKDVLAEKGAPLTCGSRLLRDFVSPYDATVVTQLKNAGALTFGRLNMDEFAMGSSTENSSVGPTCNPWDYSRIPGGSSGGSAASVVADECIASLGSDTGGSIRQPASLCGCVGLKPTYGRVSRYGLVAFASSLDQVGCNTKTVSDAATMLGVISGYDKRDSTSVPRSVPEYSAALQSSIKGMKIGLPKEYFVEGMQPEVASSIRQAVEKLEELGAEIVEVSLPHTEYAVACYYIIATAEASTNLARFDGIRYGYRVDGKNPFELYCATRGSGFGEEVKRRIILGTYVLSSGYYDAYYLKAQKVRSLIAGDFTKVFETVDALVTPTSPTTAWKLGEKMDDPLQMYLSDVCTLSSNLAGNCGISIPCGFTDNPTLPIGLQLLGPPFSEETLLKIAGDFEQATDWHCRKPVINNAGA